MGAWLRGFARVRSATAAIRHGLAILCPRASFRKLALAIVVGSCQSPQPPGCNRTVPSLSEFRQPRRRIEKGYRQEANGHEDVSRNTCPRTRKKSNGHGNCNVDCERERARQYSKGKVGDATFSFSERECHWGPPGLGSSFAVAPSALTAQYASGELFGNEPGTFGFEDQTKVLHVSVVLSKIVVEIGAAGTSRPPRRRKIVLGGASIQRHRRRCSEPCVPEMTHGPWATRLFSEIAMSGGKPLSVH